MTKYDKLAATEFGRFLETMLESHHSCREHATGSPMGMGKRGRASRVQKSCLRPACPSAMKEEERCQEAKPSCSGLTLRRIPEGNGRRFIRCCGMQGLLALAAMLFSPMPKKRPIVMAKRLCRPICSANCFQACMLNAHVRDGKVVKMSRGDYPEEIYSGCCLRGLSIPERTYSDNRLKYPLKRVEGTDRGAGEWERISWDQAH